ncbi:BLUF domain-containing protein [Brevundimonas sp.]|uniref:BLUF domain-containing protein n=1 Tax=Brevundimonas sp. TaxID=1871086 RepID=UPI002E14ACF2|nr:BLUF domain-containing protein [Brevundimonas sp.]
MLRRVVFISRTLSPAGLSTMALAHILGAAERNNRQADVTAGMVLHGDRVVEAMEGPDHVIARALERIHADPRHTDVEVILDAPVTSRALNEPMAVCDDPEAFLRAVGVPCLSLLTAEMAQDVLERRLAA